MSEPPSKQLQTLKVTALRAGMFVLMVGAITGGLMALLKARAALDAQAEFYAVKSLDTPLVPKRRNPTVGASAGPTVGASTSPTVAASAVPTVVASAGPTVVVSTGPTAVANARPADAASAGPKTPVSELLTGSITVRPGELPMAAPRDGSGSARDEEQSEAWDAEAGKKENGRVVTISIRRGRESPLVYVVPRE